MHNIDWYEPINEAYIGKTKDIIAMEKAIHNIRADHIGDIYFVNADTSEFNRLAEKVFGFKTFALNIIPGATFNAFTCPIDYRLDSKTLTPKASAICDKKGFKYKKEAGYCCIVNIYSGLIFSDLFTDGEIMAIILHEIGHNFSNIIDKGIEANTFILKYLCFIFFIINIFNGRLRTSQLSLNSLEEFKLKVEKDIKEKLPGLAYIVGFFRGIKGIAIDLFYNICGLLGLIFPVSLSKVYKLIVEKLCNLLYSPTGYNNEKLSDNFATVYGYGPELASALSKFETNTGVLTSDTINKIPVIGDIVALKSLPVEIILSAFDEHPIWFERSQDQIRLLEAELKKSSLDPKMKKVIENNIEEIKKSQEEYKKYSVSKHNATVYKKAWYSFIFNISDGDIRHKVVGKNNFENIDKALGTEESANLLDW